MPERARAEYYPACTFALTAPEKELKLRDIDLSDYSSTALILISESDTSYGRILPDCFAATVASQVSNRGFLASTNSDMQHREINSRLTNSTRNWFPKNVESFAYLRGLDGTPASHSAQKQDSKAKREDGLSQDLARTTEDYERAQGEAQLDYVRRLADEIDKWQDAFFVYNHCMRPRLAIGVLGSDTYDKLILLEALRGKFKNAVFFATDLDARYLERRQQEFCRNLLIVSAEGLEPQFSNAAPFPMPFRDGYQTAVFNACSHVINGWLLRVRSRHARGQFRVNGRQTRDLGLDRLDAVRKLRFAKA